MHVDTAELTAKGIKGIKLAIRQLISQRAAIRDMRRGYLQ